MKSLRLARLFASLTVALGLGLGSGARAEPKPAPKVVPRDAECLPLPKITGGAKFKAGELLSFDVDVLTANAARMETEVMQKKGDAWQIQTRITTNTLFNKVRRVKAECNSWLDAKTLHPRRYTEDAHEDERWRPAEVNFFPKGQEPKTVEISWATDPKSRADWKTVYGRYGNDALDVLGATFTLRSLDLKANTPLCFDVYAMRTMWRVWGQIGGIEKVRTPAGEFDAFHFVGTSAKLNQHEFQRELHLWVSADDRRLPVGAMGVIDLGPIRAQLIHVGRTDDGAPKQSRVKAIEW